jgi:hypothetical protein
VTAAAYAVVGLILAGCAVYAASILAGHERLACLDRTIGIHTLIIWTLACIAAVYVWRTIRHPLLYARDLAVRVIRRPERRDPDGEPLDRDEMRAYIDAVRAWRLPAAPEPERSRT